MKHIHELEALREQLATKAADTITALYTENENAIFADAAEELDTGGKSATIEIPVTIKIPLQISRQKIAFTATIEWERRHKTKDEADEVSVDLNPKLPGMQG